MKYYSVISICRHFDEIILNACDVSDDEVEPQVNSVFTITNDFINATKSDFLKNVMSAEIEVDSQEKEKKVKI